MIYEAVNAYYFKKLNDIGGIESHLYYLAKKYGRKHDITVFFLYGYDEQVERIGQYAHIYKIDKRDRIRCENLFCCFNREILDFCEADNKYLVLHGDYLSMVEQGQLSRANLPLDPRIDKYLGVSQLVCDSWERLTGIKAEFVGEPVKLDAVDRPLLFISATRLTVEKGYGRMVRLAEEMDRQGINYLWLVFTDTNKPNTKNMIFLKPRLDITDKIGMADAYIQLSDNEGFCLSIVEALKRGIPVICTDLPVLKEIGLNEANSIKLPLDMSFIDIEAIKHIRTLNVRYKEPKDEWPKYLSKKKNKAVKKNGKIKVRATSKYKERRLTDRELGRIPRPNEEWTITKARLDEIIAFEKRTGNKLVEIIYDE